MAMRRTKNPDGSPAKRKIGRPTKYRPQYDEQAYRLTLLGSNNEQLAEFFDVNVERLNQWRKAYPSFHESIKRGKETADSQVTKSLFHRATGYSHPEEKIFLHEGQPVRVETTKHYPPDTTAIIFWLSNRRPDLWRRNPDNAQASSPAQPVNVTIKVDKNNDVDASQVHSS